MGLSYIFYLTLPKKRGGKSRIFDFFRRKCWKFPKIFVPLHPLCSPDGGIGRRAGLKHQWGNPCRFDPGSGYKYRLLIA